MITTAYGFYIYYKVGNYKRAVRSLIKKFQIIIKKSKNVYFKNVKYIHKPSKRYGTVGLKWDQQAKV